MKNWKTSLAGLLTSVGLVLTTNNNPTFQTVGTIAAAVGTLLMGMSGKDFNVTGGTVAATPEATERVIEDKPLNQ